MNEKTNLSFLSKEILEKQQKEAFELCSKLIENFSEDKIMEKAVEGIAYLAIKRKDLIPQTMLKLLHLIKNKTNREKSKEMAIKNLATLACSNEVLIQETIKSLKNLIQTKERKNFVSVIFALSRIGRTFPTFQNEILNFFGSISIIPNLEDLIESTLLIGFGKLSQSNNDLKSKIFPKLIQACNDQRFNIRCGGIIGLGYACNSLKKTENDENIQEKCFEIAISFLNDGGIDQKKFPNLTEQQFFNQEQVFIVQIAALKALQILLKSNVKLWWDKLSQLFCKIVINSNYRNDVKFMVFKIFGKNAIHLSEENPYFISLWEYLTSLMNNEDLNVKESTFIVLSNFAVSDQKKFSILFQSFSNLMKNKKISETQEKTLEFLLSPWCKLISSEYPPNAQKNEKIINQTSSKLLCDYLSKGSKNILSNENLNDKKDEEKQEIQVKKNDPKEDFLNPYERKKTPIETQEKINNTQNQPAQQTKSKLLEVCTDFSTVVLTAVITAVKQPEVLTNTRLIAALKLEIDKHIEKKKSKDKEPIQQEGLLNAYFQLEKMDQEIKDRIIEILTNPNVLQNLKWIQDFQYLLMPSIEKNPGKENLEKENLEKENLEKENNLEKEKENNLEKEKEKEKENNSQKEENSKSKNIEFSNIDEESSDFEIDDHLETPKKVPEKNSFPFSSLFNSSTKSLLQTDVVDPLLLENPNQEDDNDDGDEYALDRKRRPDHKEQVVYDDIQDLEESKRQKTRSNLDHNSKLKNKNKNQNENENENQNQNQNQNQNSNGDEEEREVCKFFIKGICYRGDSCTFSHDLKKVPCRFYNSRRGCKNGSKCPYMHEPKTESDKRRLEKWRSENREKNSNRSNRNYEKQDESVDQQQSTDSSNVGLGLTPLQVPLSSSPFPFPPLVFPPALPNYLNPNLNQLNPNQLNQLNPNLNQLNPNLNQLNQNQLNQNQLNQNPNFQMNPAFLNQNLPNIQNMQNPYLFPNLTFPQSFPQQQISNQQNIQDPKQQSNLSQLFSFLK